MHQNPCSNWSSAHASKADVSRHVDVCQISFRAQRCVRTKVMKITVTMYFRILETLVILRAVITTNSSLIQIYCLD